MTDAAPAYVELHCHSAFSLLDGASLPETLLKRAALLGMDALALTDHDALYGAVRFTKAAHEIGVRPIFGCELTLHDGHHLTLLVQDATGWQNLCTLITLARHNAPKGKALLPKGALEEHTAGLIALSGCRQGEVMRAIRRNDPETALTAANHYVDLFGCERFCIELQNHLLPGDSRSITAGVALAERLGVRYGATNNVHYADASGHRLQDVLVCIRHNTTLDESEHLRRPNSEYYLKDAAQMERLFAQYPTAINTTKMIAEQCSYDVTFGLQELPLFPTPNSLTAHDYLVALCRERFGDDCPSNVARQLEYELSVIERSGLSNYFLIVWDLVRFAKAEGIRCQGRGSAANSLVAYTLGISPINPLDHNLVFERFLSDERQAVPDIDIDFDAARREEVIQYVYRTYGHEHAAMACTFVTFRARSALRDVGKALGLPPELLDRASSAINPFADVLTDEPGFQEALNGRAASDVWATLVSLCNAIDGFPRHLGIHNGGMVATGTSLAARLPTEPATMQNRSVVQWDKDSLEDAGLVKIDILGLRMLAAISDAVQILKQSGEFDEVSQLAFDDPAVFEMIAHADTVGVFQVESRAQAQVLPRLRPRTFNDLIVSISLIRPGPVMGNMVHPYLRRRLGQEPVRYSHPILQPALEETLGVVLFQEQVLKVARDMGGFTGGQGERMRRALGSKRASDEIKKLYDAFMEGALTKDVERTIASMVFDTLKAFGGYSFPKSHAAAFAVIVYQSAWLKKYHPAAFYCGLLRNQPMGFWSPAVVVGDAKRHGIRVLPPHVNHSDARTIVQEGAIRMGLDYVHRIGEDAAARIVDARVGRAFKDLSDFCRRAQLPQQVIENLIMAGALDGWGKSRRNLVLELGTLDYRAHTLPFEYHTDVDVMLPELDALEEQDIELMLLGVALHDHPIQRYRDTLLVQGILGSREVLRCPARSLVKVCGMIVVHQAPPTAKGFHFVTLEDEEGFLNIVVRPDVYVRYRKVLRESSFLIVEGYVEKQGIVTNVVAREIRPLVRMA
jgi:error-prone DNA polymerase